MVSEGLICTNENCIACNRCISACSCPGATIATVTDDGKNIIGVDGERCIACGACIDACEHHAREFVDDTAAFFNALKRGEDISVMFAPALPADYPDEYESILGKLKTLGVSRFISVAFGADITTWAYLNYISSHDFHGGVSQPCPAVVDYIEKYIPELIPKLIPVQSPMMCAAIYARKHMKLKGKLAFIGPCIAKKKEIQSERGKGIISYSITFDHLMKYLRTISVESSEFEIETQSGLGSVYSMPGGLKENIHWFIGKDAFVRQVEGEKSLYRYLRDNKDRILDKNSPYTLLDVLNCTGGCLCGTGVEENTSAEETLIRMMKIKSEHVNSTEVNAWSEGLTPKMRLAAFNRQFSELDLNDYICSYTDRSKECAWKYPDWAELDNIFEDMNKTTPESRKLNCGACGYNSCREMAVAIYNGFNHKNNCVHYTKDILEDISDDFPTVLVINGQKQDVHIIKYTDEKAVKSWIESGLNLMDYNRAIKEYIDRYVEEKDRKRVWSEVEFSSLCRHLAESDKYIVTFLRHPEIGESGYYQLHFNKKPGSGDIVLSFRDVDDMVREERKREKRLAEALKAAEAANKAKSTFLANMSHEIRTPINAILGMDTMILRESTQDNVLEYAKNVKSAGNTLLSLINDILDFSKIESGKLEIIPAKYRLDSVINDIFNMVRGRAEEKGLELVLNISDGIPSQLVGDEVRIKQAALNLINNAVKYTNEGRVTLGFECERISSDRTLLKCSVKDTGVGIKKEDIGIIFSPYDRLEENKNKLIEGTGLGLAITRDLIERMGGKISVESEYGKGSCFTFVIPQDVWGTDIVNHNEFNKLSGNEQQEELEAFHAPDACVLAVDDVEMNLEVLKNLLKRSKISPDVCMSGKEAVKLSAEKKYDLILMDAMMPEMSGEDTLHAIRKECPQNADTPVIVITANAILGAKESYINEGFTEYLSKPIDGVKLEKMIYTYLPKEKIIPVTGEEEIIEEQLSQEEESCLNALKGSAAVDTEKGITAAGDVKTYLTVSRNFYDTSENRMEMIREYFEKNDIPNYTIQVHALKSSARLVGAGDLSEHAKSLEMAGKENDTDKIKKETGTLLEEYAEIVGILGKAFVSENETEEAKPELPTKKFRRRLMELQELIEAFDFETGKQLFDELGDYSFADGDTKVYKKLKMLMAEVDHDEILKVLGEYLG